MAPISTLPARPFGTVLTAMVTPFDENGAVDLVSTRRVARHLLDTGCDSIVVHGTTGESPTTTLAEKLDVMAAVREEVGPDVCLVVGAGTNDTAKDLASLAELSALANGLLVVAPYYNKPTPAGLRAHFTAIADATELPVMLYDIPGRSGIAIPTDLLLELAQHPRIVAVKDARGDLFAATRVLAESDLAVYSGIDELNFAFLALGAAGMVSVVGHLAARQLADLAAAVDAGDLGRAREIDRGLWPLVDAVMCHGPGVAGAKAGLHHLGVIAHNTLRLPMTVAEADVAQRIISAVKPLS